MCYSKETSFAAWGVSLLISIFLYKRNNNYDRWNAAFILTFTTIQLLEGGVWFSIEKGNSVLNCTLTKLIFIALFLQPLVQTYLGAQYTGSSILYTATLVYVILLLWACLRMFSGKEQSTVGENGHLVWSSLENMNGVISILYLGGLLVPLLFMENNKGIPLVIIGLLTALYSYIKTDFKEFSSMWCFTAVIYGGVALFV